MSDIVERLTDLAIDVEQTDFDCQSQMLNEAADEIERLRAGGCARNQRTTQWCAEAVDAIARAKAAEAHVAALREALSSLVKLNDECSYFGGEMYRDRIERTWDRARAALEEK